jgi:hypothetical protein
MKIEFRWALLRKFGFIAGLIPLIGCAGMGGTRDIVRFNNNMPNEPIYTQRYFWRGIKGIRYVIAGESVTEWTEVFDMAGTTKRKVIPQTVEEAYRERADTWKKECQESTSNIINQEQSSILFEIHAVNCPPNPYEARLIKVMFGTKNVVWLYYTNKIKELPPEKRDEWIKFMSGVSITSE